MGILVLDVGTTGARAVLFDETGSLQGMSYREYHSRFGPEGVVDHNPETWRTAVFELVPQVLRQTGVSPNGVTAVAVTTQRATVFPVNREGEPLAWAMSWQDKRTLPECKVLTDRLGEGELYRVTGLRIDPYFSLPKLMWFQRHQPDVYHAAFRFVTVHDWVVQQLTGRFVTDWTQASRTQLFDITRREWAPELARAAGLPDVPLPEVMPPGSLAGGLTKNAALRLGLREGTPVVAAGGDQQAAAVGLGVIQPGWVQGVSGTGSFLVAPVLEPQGDDRHRVLCSVSAVPGQWILEAGILTTGAVYRWLRNMLQNGLSVGDVGVVGKSTTTLVDDPYVLLDELAAAAPVGAGGVLVLPHLAGSAAPYWDPKAQGVIVGLQLGTTAAHLARGVLEGVALEVGKNLQVMASLMSQKLTEIRVSGGLTRSRLFNQIQADVYGLPVQPGRLEETSALGAAVLAAVAVGIYSDLSTAVAGMTGVLESQRAWPRPEEQRQYQKLLRRHDAVYRALADAGVFHGTEIKLDDGS